MSLAPNKQFDWEYIQEGVCPIGVDEAGRGPIAGPVVSCAVQVDSEIYTSDDYAAVYDSKSISAKLRQEIFNQASQDPRIQYSLSIISHSIIDQINIYQATIQSMSEAISKLEANANSIILTDGLALNFNEKLTTKVIKGDQKSFAIALASIFAKETRDLLMCEMAAQYPGYGFDKHKGYPTKSHKQALIELGPCTIHRKTYAPVKEALTMSTQSSSS